MFVRFLSFPILLLLCTNLVGQTPGTDSYGDPLPPGALARMGTTRLRQTLLTLVEFSPDGRTLASTSGSEVWLFEAATGKRLNRIDVGWTGWPDMNFCFAPDGKTLFRAGKGRIREWDIASAKEVRTIPTSEGANYLAISPDRKMLAAVSAKDECSVTVYEITTGKQVGTLSVEGSLNLIQWVPGTKVLALQSAPNPTYRVLSLWDVAAGTKKERVLNDPANDEPDCVAVAPGGRLLFVGTARGEIRRIDLDKNDDMGVVLTGRPHRVVSLRLSPDGGILAAMHQDSTIQLWRLADRRPTALLKDISTWPRALAFSPDGKTLATGGRGRVIRLWDVATGTEKFASSAPVVLAYPLAFSADGKTLLALGDDQLRFWDSATGKETQPSLPVRYADAAVVSPDLKLLAMSRFDQRLDVWDIASGQKQVEFAGGGGHVGYKLLGSPGLTFSPGGNRLAASDQHNRVIVYDPGLRQKIRTLSLETSLIHSLAFSLDGSKLVVAGGTSEVPLWDVDNNKKLATFTHPNWASSVAFSLDGRTLVTAGADRAILWEVASGKQRKSFASWPTVVLSPDGRLLASAGADEVAIRDLASGDCIEEIRARSGAVHGVVFSPDGKRIAVGYADTTILIWNVASVRSPQLALTAKEVEARWEALRSLDAEAAYRAVHQLARSPVQSVPLIRDRLKPVPESVRARIVKLIADLDSNVYAVRNKATAELSGYGDLSRPLLEQRLKTAPPLETRRRIDELLNQPISMSPELLRAVRSVEVLQLIGTREARQVLDGLANGFHEARLSREARIALDCLARQPLPK